MPQSVAALAPPPAAPSAATIPGAIGVASSGPAPTFAGLLALVTADATPGGQPPTASVTAELPQAASPALPVAQATLAVPLPVPSLARTAAQGGAPGPRSPADARRNITTQSGIVEAVDPGLVPQPTPALLPSAALMLPQAAQPGPAGSPLAPMDAQLGASPSGTPPPQTRRPQPEPSAGPAPARAGPTTEPPTHIANTLVPIAPATAGADTSLPPTASPISSDPSIAPMPQTTAASPTPPVHAIVASPAAQVAPALLALAHAPDGAQRLILRLEPPELGQVEIKIDRPADAPARVEISVQRSDTLTLLLRDQPQLQRALDQAGVPTEGRSLTFHLATPPATGSSAGAHGMSGGAGNGADPGSTGRGTAPAQQDSAPNDDEPGLVALPMPHRWLRAGLDITA